MRKLPTRSQVAAAAAIAWVAVGLAVRSPHEPVTAHLGDLAAGCVAAALAARALVGRAHVRAAVLGFLVICGAGLSHLAYAGPVFSVYEVLVLATALAFGPIRWWRALLLATCARAGGLAAFYLLV